MRQNRSANRIRFVEKYGIPELVEALKAGKVTSWRAEIIAHMPKEKQVTALKDVQSMGRAGYRKIPEFTAEEAAQDEACLEYICRPSIYPTDARLPAGDGEEARLLQAITWLREHEPRIKFFTARKQCDELLRCTNVIASYRDNWSHAPRLDGELDPRILEWQQTIWQKRLRQQERIALQRNLRFRAQSKLAPVKRKVRLPFDDRFNIFWSIIESNLKTFRPNERLKIGRAFRRNLKEFFSDISAERNGLCRVADNSNSTTEIVAIR